ncbi:DoxX family protein [Virgibacillus sediminis]|uniref:DoxX family protein n=1 Tax=Virgibacillus sediminis TaxID=202260 RepID=A0ABV7A241_9BACI
MTILAWLLQFLLAAVFLMAGGFKIAGANALIDQFDHLKLPQWFRVVTGWVEIGIALLLIIGFWIPSSAIAGAILFIIVGIGGILSHISAKDGVKDNIPISALTAMAIIFLIIV